MSPAKKGESALGRGLDALIRKEKPKDLEKEEKKVESQSKARKKTTKKTSATKRKTPRTTEKSKKEPKPGIDPDKVILDTVVLEVRKNPRISLWSAKSAAVLRFLKNTKPAFSISKEASRLIEEAVQQEYPEIWEMFEDEKF